jgi:outer membrane protein
MKASFIITAFSLALVAGSVRAQTPPPKPTGPTTPPATPPATAPAQPAPLPAAQPPKPFPEGAKIAYVNVQRIASESADGKAATGRITALREKKEKELQSKNSQLDEARKKLESSGSVLSDSARSQQQKEVERLQVDLQRSTQDAQAEVEELQRELQVEFQKKLLPIIGEVASAKGLMMVLSSLDSGLVWADPGLDITADVIKRLDSGGTAPTAPAKK